MKQSQVLDIVRELRGTFDMYFNQTWFYLVLEDLPIDDELIREIRNFLVFTPIELLDENAIRDGAESLERFVWKLRVYMLPNIKEILRISSLSPSRKIKNKEEFLRMKLLGEVLPANVEQLAATSRELMKTVHSYRYSSGTGDPLPASASGMHLI